MSATPLADYEEADTRHENFGTCRSRNVTIEANMNRWESREPSQSDRESMYPLGVEELWTLTIVIVTKQQR